MELEGRNAAQRLLRSSPAGALTPRTDNWPWAGGGGGVCQSVVHGCRDEAIGQVWDDTVLKEAIFAHPTLGESLNNPFMALDSAA